MLRMWGMILLWSKFLIVFNKRNPKQFFNKCLFKEAILKIDIKRDTSVLKLSGKVFVINFCRVRALHAY